jgi:DNA polymerase-1
MNREALKTVFSELEFKALSKRVLGEEPVAETVVITQQIVIQPEGEIIVTGQLDLFANTVEQGTGQRNKGRRATNGPPANDLVADKNIHNTPHNYTLVNTPEAINDLIAKLSPEKEISFDTETTNIDANCAELVGLSFS